MVKFTSNEIRDIIISMLVIAFVFAYIFGGRNISNTINWIPVTLIAVGVGFVFHELAHKFVAIRYGYWAEYKMWVEGLIIALLTSIALGFVFAAPGAVYIHGVHISKEENGKISLAGPVTNILLALLFILLLPFVYSSEIFLRIAMMGTAVNSFLAFFNLMPFTILDGAKIFAWNKLIWAIMAALAFFLMMRSFFGFGM